MSAHSSTQVAAAFLCLQWFHQSLVLPSTLHPCVWKTNRANSVPPMNSQSMPALQNQVQSPWLWTMLIYPLLSGNGGWSRVFVCSAEYDSISSLFALSVLLNLWWVSSILLILMHLHSSLRSPLLLVISLFQYSPSSTLDQLAALSRGSSAINSSSKEVQSVTGRMLSFCHVCFHVGPIKLRLSQLHQGSLDFHVTERLTICIIPGHSQGIHGKLNTTQCNPGKQEKSWSGAKAVTLTIVWSSSSWKDHLPSVILSCDYCQHFPFVSNVLHCMSTLLSLHPGKVCELQKPLHAPLNLLIL